MGATWIDWKTDGKSKSFAAGEKSFLRRIVRGDEKRIYFENSERKTS